MPAKKKSTPPITEPSPEVISRDEAREKRYRAEDDYRLAERHHEMTKDKERVREMKKIAREKVKMAKAIC